MEDLVMLQQLEQAYQGKRVFVTGHTGFKGSWMLAVLQQLGAKVKGYALAPEDEPNLFTLLGGDKLCHSVIADIRDRQKLQQEIESFQPDYIFHLAAQALVRRSYEQPAETYEVNVQGTVNLLDAARAIENKCDIVIVTTDKVYENRELWYPYKESDPLGGFDPYSSSKACAEIAVASYRRSFFHHEKYKEHKKAIASARAGNVIGGGDWSKDRIIPDLVKALDAGEALMVRNPQAVRPWQHVLEPVSAYLLLGAKLNEDPARFAEAYNFGPYTDDNLTVEKLVETALQIWGSGKYEPAPDTTAPHEAKLLQLDISKAVNELHWKPRWNAEMALKATLEWYREHRDNAAAVTNRQIQTYLNS